MLPLGGLCDLLDDSIALMNECQHVTSQKQDLGQRSKKGKWGGDGKGVRHFGHARWKRSKQMVGLHEAEDALNHCDLKMGWQLQGRGLAGQAMSDAEVFGAPSDLLAETDEA